MVGRLEAIEYRIPRLLSGVAELQTPVSVEDVTQPHGQPQAFGEVVRGVASEVAKSLEHERCVPGLLFDDGAVERDEGGKAIAGPKSEVCVARVPVVDPSLLEPEAMSDIELPSGEPSLGPEEDDALPGPQLEEITRSLIYF